MILPLVVVTLSINNDQKYKKIFFCVGDSWYLFFSYGQKPMNFKCWNSLVIMQHEWTDACPKQTKAVYMKKVFMKIIEVEMEIFVFCSFQHVSLRHAKTKVTVNGKTFYTKKKTEKNQRNITNKMKKSTTVRINLDVDMKLHFCIIIFDRDIER